MKVVKRVNILNRFSKCRNIHDREAHDFEKRLEAYYVDDGVLFRAIGQCKRCGRLEDDEIFYLDSARLWENTKSIKS